MRDDQCVFIISNPFELNYLLEHLGLYQQPTLACEFVESIIVSAKERFSDVSVSYTPKYTAVVSVLEKLNMSVGNINDILVSRELDASVNKILEEIIRHNQANKAIYVTNVTDMQVAMVGYTFFSDKENSSTELV